MLLLALLGMLCNTSSRDEEEDEWPTVEDMIEMDDEWDEDF